MQLQFLGAAHEVTGAMYRLEVNGASILLDCGLQQGHRRQALERNRHFPFDPTRLHALILSHAHLDHSGDIPVLVAQGFEGNIYATSGTRDLCSAMLRDAGHIQEQDAAYLNKKHARRGEEPVEPLYTVAQATRALHNFVDLCYGRPFQVAPGVQAAFFDAGHILGSAITLLDLEEGSTHLRLAYSGDLGSGGGPILRDPADVHEIDALIIEGTYGGRRHEAPDDAEARLQQIVNDTWERGGRLIVPAFAVGRTQTLVYQLHQLVERQAIPQVTIFVDSPLAVNVTEIFRLHPECLNPEVMAMLDTRHDPFGFNRLRYVRSSEESKALNAWPEPAIIISASGMAEAGRVLHHLKHALPDPRNAVLLVGYQAENTLGRRLLERPPEVPIYGEMVPLRARVEIIHGYSAHPDHQGLMAWVRAARDRCLRQVFVVHGEPPQADALARALRELGGLEVHVPAPGETLPLGQPEVVGAQAG